MSPRLRSVFAGRVCRLTGSQLVFEVRGLKHSSQDKRGFTKSPSGKTALWGRRYANSLKDFLPAMCGFAVKVGQPTGTLKCIVG
jgi:hypothetical protein